MDLVLSNEFILLILASFVALALVVLIILVIIDINRKSSVQDEKKIDELNESIKELKFHANTQANFFKMQQDSLDKRLGSQQESIEKKFTNIQQFLMRTQGDTNNVIKDVNKSIGAVMEKTQSLENFTKEIVSLQDLLKPPKMRGGLGEALLENILKQIVPNNYKMQHRFKNNSVVDAVILLGDKLVPIDSKFPLENFNRYIEENDENAKKTLKRAFVSDVTKRINEITDKYINTNENTYEFAFMYIPAENIYYEVIITESLMSYSRDKKVIPVSPNSFYAYLMAIAYGLKGLEIEKNAKDIYNKLTMLKSDFAKFGENFNVLGSHIRNASNKFDDCSRLSDKYQDKLAGLSGIEEKDSDKLIK